MVVIRLARNGSKGKAFFDLVATNNSSPRDGKNLERLGFFNPHPSGRDTELNINLDRVDYWLSQGAQPSDTAQDLIKRARNLATISSKVAAKAPEAATKAPKAAAKAKASDKKDTDK